MGKFRFSDYTTANPANPAKVTDNKGYPPANNLLTIANVKEKKPKTHSTLANISKTLAEQEPCKINDLSNFSNFSRGEGINIEKKKVQKLQDQVNYLWDKAWKLADWIVDSESDIPWQERAFKVPELQKMSWEIDRLKAKRHTGQIDIEKLDNVSLQDSAITQPHKNRINSDNCPARCKRSGDCYGRAYFLGKPGKPEHCMPDQCPWVEHYIKQERTT